MKGADARADAKQQGMEDVLYAAALTAASDPALAVRVVLPREPGAVALAHAAARGTGVKIAIAMSVKSIRVQFQGFSRID